MRLIAICTALGLTILTFVLAAVGCFTPAWWVSADGVYNVGLWQYCKKEIPTKICRSFHQKFFIKAIDEEEEDVEIEIDDELDSVRAPALISMISCFIAVLFISVILHFVRRKTQVQIALWLKVLTLVFNLLTTFSAIVSCIEASNKSSIFHQRMKLKGSWLCMIIASVLSFVIGICLITVFIVKKQQQTAERRRKFTATLPPHTELSSVHSMKRAKSPPFVIPTTPYHNHPYIQYHADEVQPHYIDGYLEPSVDLPPPTLDDHNIDMKMVSMANFSSEQYADLSFEDLPKENNLSTSYANLTHSYEDVPATNENAEVL